MSNSKYFSLIYGSNISQAPQTKVIPAKDLAKLLSSEEVLSTIVTEAEKYRQQIVAECEVIKEQAEKEGFEEGYRQWSMQLAKLEDEIARVRDEMQKMIIPISLKAAKKIVSSELLMSPQAITEIVSNTLRAVAAHKRIVIYVNKADLDVLEKSKSKIKQIFESLESLSIRDRDDIEQGGCIIETEGGIINARLKDRWKNLEAAFESLGDTLRKNP